MPLVAAYGPWSIGFGLKNEWVEIKAVIVKDNDTLTVTATKQTRVSPSSSVQLEELQNISDLNLSAPSESLMVVPLVTITSAAPNSA